MANTLINNIVLGEIIGAELPHKLRFGGLAKVDNTLQGQAGDIIKVEKYGYIGEAEKVLEGQPIPVTDLGMTSRQVTLGKAGKGVKLSDEEVQRRGAAEITGEVKSQIMLSVADKVDSDAYAALKTTKLKHTCAGKITMEDIVRAISLFASEDDNERYVLYINPAQEADIILAPGFIPASNFGDQVLVNGAIGRLGGADIVRSAKVKKVANKYHNVIERGGALGIKLGNSVGIEEDRNKGTQVTTWYGSEVYVVYLAKDDGAVEVVTTEA